MSEADVVVIRRRVQREQVSPDATQIILCQRCKQPLAYSAGGKLKLSVRSRVLAFTGDGIAELKCPHCGLDTPVPQIRLAAPAPDQI